MGTSISCSLYSEDKRWWQILRPNTANCRVNLELEGNITLLTFLASIAGYRQLQGVASAFLSFVPNLSPSRSSFILILCSHQTKATFPSSSLFAWCCDNLHHKMSSNGRCASFQCRNPGTSKCSKCRVTWYCNRDCQKAHFPRHKLHCKAHTPMPNGVLGFLRLPREIRNQVSKQ
jgi:hypothetical protein